MPAQVRLSNGNPVLDSLCKSIYPLSPRGCVPIWRQGRVDPRARQGNDVSRFASVAPNRPAVRRCRKPRIRRSGDCGAMGSVYGNRHSRRLTGRSAVGLDDSVLDGAAASTLLQSKEPAQHSMECSHADTALGQPAIHGMRRERGAHQFGATRTSIRSAVWPAPRVSTG